MIKRNGFLLFILVTMFTMPATFAQNVEQTIDKTFKSKSQSDKSTWLYVQQAPRGKLISKNGVTGELVLIDAHKQTLSLTDRPVRRIEKISTNDFVKSTWYRGKNNFKKQNPTVPVTFITKDKHGKAIEHLLFLKLSNPELVGSNLVYRVQNTDGKSIPNLAFNEVSITLNNS